GCDRLRGAVRVQASVAVGSVMYLFDENTSYKLISFMNRIGIRDADSLVRAYVTGTKDEDLIPRLARDRHLLVTNDQKMKTEHRALLQQYGVRVLFLPEGYSEWGRLGQAEFIIGRWRRITSQIDALPNIQLLRVNKYGRVSALPLRVKRNRRSVIARS
ncbi:MAG TPA: hypothetical protein VFW40_00375, partial [Capsulimonadaceae bacterium]|nr:hypothetical protein [Capsulimonadaceae bacterium]